MRKPRKPSPDCGVGQELMDNPGLQPLGARLWRKEELRAAGNSRASWPSYETADVAKPTTIYVSNCFSWAGKEGLGSSHRLHDWDGDARRVKTETTLSQKRQDYVWIIS